MAAAVLRRTSSHAGVTSAGPPRDRLRGLGLIEDIAVSTRSHLEFHMHRGGAGGVARELLGAWPRSY